MIDVKKLVTGFLILAVAVSASALLISTIGANVGSAKNNAGVAVVANAVSPVTGNAFLPVADSQAANQALANITDPSDPVLESSTNAIMSDPNNLTNVLANAYINNLALTNPDGLQVDGSGNQTLTPPDSNTVIAQFESSSSPASVQLPDWDAEADQIPITITSSSQEALTAYGTALGAILDQSIVQANLQSMLNNNSDPSFEPYVGGKVQTTLQDISGLKTPASAVALQKSLIKTLVYAKNALALGENVASDPLKTELILEGEGIKYDIAVQDLQTQLQKAQAEKLFSFGTEQAPDSGNKILAGIASILGVPVAHAQLFGGIVFDPTNNIGIWATVAQLIKNEIKDIILQIVKNTIVFIMQKTIIAGIQGSGAPKFIQQWGTTLANAFQQSALGALNSQMACVGAAPFAAGLKLTLAATYKPGNNNICAVQFNNQLGNNLGNFYNNFSNGGWLTFGSTLQPDNNYYGSAFFIAQTVGNTAQNAQNAASAKAVAGQGFHGTAVCSDGSNPNGQSSVCQDANGVWSTIPGSSCPAGTTLVGTVPNEGSCTNGTEPQVQTPGAILNGMVGSALDGNFKLVTSANSWTGLASGLFVSILQETLNSLAKTAIAGVNGLLQQASDGGGANSVNTSTLNVTGGASAPQPMTCYVTPAVSGNPLQAQIMVSGGETVSKTGITTPSYVWSQPAGGTLTPTTGDTVVGTFNASGTYQVAVNDTVDKIGTTCTVTIPQP